MGILKQYKSIPVKDTCMLFYLSPFFGPGLSDGVIYIFP